MNGMALTPAIAALLASAALLGCGGGDDNKSSTAAATTNKAPRPIRADLERPLYPQCSFPRFAKPHVQSFPGPTGGGKAWQVAFIPRGRTVRPPEVTSNVMIVEESPKLTHVGVQGGSIRTVAHRRVSIRPPTPKSAVYAAQWNTRAAHYTALANGKTSTVLERFIACMP
jgi:hypothetical protein